MIHFAKYHRLAPVPLDRWTNGHYYPFKKTEEGRDIGF